MFAKRGPDGRRHLRLDPGGRFAADVMDVESEALTFAYDGWRICEQPLESRDVEGGRHRKDAQVFAECACSIQREREREIVVQAPFVHFVEHHRRYAGVPGSA